MLAALKLCLSSLLPAPEPEPTPRSHESALLLNQEYNPPAKLDQYNLVQARLLRIQPGHTTDACGSTHTPITTTQGHVGGHCHLE